VFRFEGLLPQEGGGTWQPPARNLHGMGCKAGNTGLTDTPISGVTLKLHLVFVPDLHAVLRELGSASANETARRADFRGTLRRHG